MMSSWSLILQLFTYLFIYFLNGRYINYLSLTYATNKNEIQGYSK